ncbi:hypothetical protein [Stenotrophomonas sp. S39]|uniref:hypothetical protein n=1 Tax=Stenotrophomonas sp. S39 TaxID=2767451 RepID=UPI00190CE8E4|nr:hypothetical protein [Stenotrophomonas sp. S39]MBK0052676.1 hypothetical protein [Stenotrophomonas sp. S39]
MAKSLKYSRIPTADEIAAFNGMHCRVKYHHAVSTGWRCPCCGRTAQQLIRWTEIRGPAWRKAYGDEYGMGFTVTLAEHHCHGDGRFPPTLICGDCNSADGAAKRKWRLPESWSFSPEELSLFVTVAPHSGDTHIDQELARQIFERKSRGNFR